MNAKPDGETKHTPGPWTISDYYSDDRAILAADGFPVCELEETAIMPGFHEKKSVEGHWSRHPGVAFVERTPDEVSANASLIAASPLMYEFIKSIANSAPVEQPERPEFTGNCDDDGDYGSAWADWCNAKNARELLANI